MRLQITALTEFIRDTRGDTPQGEFQEELEELVYGPNSPKSFGAKYISLVETGARRVLSDDLLTALAKRTNKSKAALEAMHSQISPVGPLGSGGGTKPVRTYSLVAGETFWAASLLGAIFKGKPRGLRMATCAAFTPLDPALPDMDGEWHPEANSVRWIEYLDGSRTQLYNPGFLSDIADPNKTKYFTAVQAKWALEAGWADLIAVPSAFVPDIDKATSLARLVNTETAGVLICGERLGKNLLGKERTGPEAPAVWDEVVKKWDSTDGSMPYLSLDTRQLGEAIRFELESPRKSRTGDSKQCRLGGEIGTVAAQLVIEAAEYAGPGMDRVWVDIAIEKAQAPSLKDLSSFCNLGDGEQLDGIVLWEPFATWVYEALRAGRARPHAFIALRHSPPKESFRSRKFEFELVTTVEKATDRFLMQLVKELLEAAAEVSHSMQFYSVGRSNATDDALAHYFHLWDGKDRNQTIKKTKRIIDSINFDVSIHPKSLHLFK